MAKTLDFNSLLQPIQEVVLKDDARTQLRLTCPSEALVERLEAGMNDLRQVLQKKDRSAIAACYTLAADLMSNNDTYQTITADDLRGKYRIGLPDLVVFFSAYTDFIAEIKNAKN